MEIYEVTVIDLNTQIEMQILVEADEAETNEKIILKAKLAGQEVVSSNYKCESRVKRVLKNSAT